jgi:hypothetical protein
MFKTTIGNLLTRMQLMAPSASEALLDELYPDRPSNMMADKPYFTGWKGQAPGYEPLFMRDPNEDIEVSEDLKFEYVAQWVYFFGDQQKAVYVNLPGLESGKIERGACFEIGENRIYSDTSQESIDCMVRDGHAKLMELVEQEGVPA